MPGPKAARVRPNLFREFHSFLDKYGVIGLAIAFIIGVALTTLIQALVQDIVTPLLKPIFAALGDGWKTAETNLGPFGPFRIGHFIDAFLSFLIIALVVFLLAKFLLRDELTPQK